MFVRVFSFNIFNDNGDTFVPHVNGGIVISSDRSSSELEYADAFALLSGEAMKLEVLDRLNEGARMPEIYFAPSVSKVCCRTGQAQSRTLSL